MRWCICLTYSRATLGAYELARVELLRDLYVWAYERSTQEYLAIKQEFRRLHEGVLARYGLRPSELAAWNAAQPSL